MSRPLLLDAFSGAGGAAMGYYRAGFDVVGVDHRPMPHFPFRFVQADALEYLAEHGAEYDVIHASPPCQKYSQVNRRAHLAGQEYPDLIAPVRQLLESIGHLWIIENVEAAPLRGAVRLCGTSFGLPIRRHRLFESSVLLFAPPCQHHLFSEPKYPTCFRPEKGKKRLSTVVQVYGHTSGSSLWPEALGIDWMNRQELSQAIPPVYTYYLGLQLRAAINSSDPASIGSPG